MSVFAIHLVSDLFKIPIKRLYSSIATLVYYIAYIIIPYCYTKQHLTHFYCICYQICGSCKTPYKEAQKVINNMQLQSSLGLKVGSSWATLVQGQALLSVPLGMLPFY